MNWSINYNTIAYLYANRYEIKMKRNSRAKKNVYARNVYSYANRSFYLI